MPENEEILDTQEEITEEVTEVEDEELETEDTEDPEGEEPEDEEFDLNLPEEENEELDTQDPLADFKALVKDNPAALKRAGEIEAGLVKLQTKVSSLEPFAYAVGMLKEATKEGIDTFEQALYDNTGLTLESMLEIQGGTRQLAPDPKETALEARVAKIESEKAATDWIVSTGSKVASAVAKETGLTFTPEQLYQATRYLKNGASVDDVRKAVMKSDPDAYDKAVAVRDGDKKAVPVGARVPSGKSGVGKNFEHTGAGFLAAYQAKNPVAK
jgi:hypothetical protein